MQKAQAVLRNGQVEFDEPVTWPDGTRLDVCPTESVTDSRPASNPRGAASLLDALENPETDGWGCDESLWPRTPEEIDAWLQWFDSCEPVFAPEEQAAFDAELAASKQLQKSLTQAAWNRQESLT